MFRSLVVTMLLLGAALASAAPAQTKLASDEDLATLATIRFGLAKLGHKQTVLDLRRILRNLGAAADDLEKSDAKCRRELGRRPRELPVPGAKLSQLRDLVSRLATRLPQLESDARYDLAFEILALDASNPEANAVLERTLVETPAGEKRWLDADDRKRLERIREVRAALRRARDFDPEIEIREITHPVHEALGYETTLELKHGKVRFVSPLPLERSRTIFLRALRAGAMLEWLISGKLEVHHAQKKYVTVLVEDEADYADAIDAAVEAKAFAAKTAPHAKQWAEYHDERGYTVQHWTSDGYSQTLLLTGLSYSRQMAPFVRAGLCNWTSEAVLGRKMPDVVVHKREKVGQTAATRERLTDEVDPATYRQAGTYGSREWMKWLVQSGAAPSILECFLADLGKIRGKELVKCTLAIEHWMENGPMLELVKDLARGRKKAGTEFVRTFERATDLTIAEFEEDWKRWLLGRAPSLVERLARARSDKETTKRLARAGKAAAHLAALRMRYFGGERMKAHYSIIPLEPRAAVHVHRELCDRGWMLAKHLAKIEREDPSDDARAEMDALRPRGAWKLGAGLIDLASTSPERTIDSWMGSFYHRVALLDPALIAIGWAEHGDVAVADASSLVDMPEGFWALTWPIDKSKNVPTRYAAFAPNPVPSAKLEDLGYPVTLQLGPECVAGKGFRVEFDLRAGSPSGELVDCWLSTPSAGTNPAFTPQRVWCLIPKKPLAKGKTYHARALVRAIETKELRWSFRTR